MLSEVLSYARQIFCLVVHCYHHPQVFFYFLYFPGLEYHHRDFLLSSRCHLHSLKTQKIIVLNKIYSRNPEIGEKPIFILLGGGKSPNKSSILNSEAAFIWSAAFLTFPRCNSGVLTKMADRGQLFHKFELALKF